MAVFEVSVTAPNGNRRTRPIVARCAEHVLAAWKAEIELETPREADRRGFVYEIRALADPDGTYERALLEAEARRLRDG
jgi:hypothetical protein